MTNQDRIKLARRAQRHLKVAAAANTRTLHAGDQLERASLLQRRDHHAREASKLVNKIQSEVTA